MSGCLYARKLTIQVIIVLLDPLDSWRSYICRFYRSSLCRYQHFLKFRFLQGKLTSNSVKGMIVFKFGITSRDSGRLGSFTRRWAEAETTDCNNRQRNKTRMTNETRLRPGRPEIDLELTNAEALNTGLTRSENNRLRWTAWAAKRRPGRKPTGSRWIGVNSAKTIN